MAAVHALNLRRIPSRPPQLRVTVGMNAAPVEAALERDADTHRVVHGHVRARVATAWPGVIAVILGDPRALEVHEVARFLHLPLSGREVALEERVAHAVARPSERAVAVEAVGARGGEGAHGESA